MKQRLPQKKRCEVITRLSSCLLSLLCASPLLGEVSFRFEIRSLLSQHCFRCHGDTDNRPTELRLDSREHATADLGGYAAVVPGDPGASELFRRIISDDPDQRMPPPDAGDALASDKIALVRQWISEGALYEAHWAYEPVEDPAVPNLDPPLTGATAIDRFIVVRLRQANLSLSPPADKHALIRRATFDLTGLPPTWEEVQDFVQDQSPEAFAKVVDRLLASPRYGERWGRHWLDIARYADTYGGGALGAKKFAFSYTYRDYVIDAFNNDLPYDQFVLQQLAADQLELAKNATSLAGLGFLTVGRRFPNPHDLIDDRIDVVTRGLLGLTVTCARCHDHKFDAISTEDYYSLYAVMASSREPAELPVVGELEDTDALRAFERELEARKKIRYDFARDQIEVMRGRLRMEVGKYLRELVKGTPERDISSAFISYRTDDLREAVLERWRNYLKALAGTGDSVFEPWHRLARLPADGFGQRAAELLEQMVAENGDPTKWEPLHVYNSHPPRWNPRVLEALRAAPLGSMNDVADAYGRLFAAMHEQWLRSLIGASREALPDVTIIPDDDLPHAEINGPVNRQLRYHLYAPGTPTAVPDELAETMLNRPIRDHLGALKAGIHQLKLNSPDSPPRAMIIEEDAAPPEHHVFHRGSPIDRGKPVRPRFLEILSRGEAGELTFADGRRRWGLAQAIIDPRNPLTRRVIVNWVWQHHFGQAIVRTPDDFGEHGEPPTHPELLDYLATSLLEDEWSLKKLHRRMMLSLVYRQAANENAAAGRVDPENHLVWRMARRRLDMESMRDAMLAAAGRLDTTMGGRPYDLFAEPFVPRRTVYGFVNRDVIPGFFGTFDAADPCACAVQRPQTTVPQQALFALNSSFIQEQASHLAERDSVATARDDSARVKALYRCVYGRLPTDDELAIALDYVDSQTDRKGSSRWERLAHVLLAANEFVFLD